MKKQYKVGAYEAIHTMAEGMYRAGVIDEAEMLEYDESCLLQPPKVAPQQIKLLRKKNHISQSRFATYLNTSKSTIEKWETGAKQPSGMALKLLSIVQKHGLEILI